MTVSLTSIPLKKTQLTDQPEIAEVISVDQKSKINKINLVAKNIHHTVITQAKHITRAAIGDTILVQNTLQGWIVIAQLANQNDIPAAHITDNEGHIQVKGAKSVTLTTKKGTIEVHENGKIILDATELSANSERDLTIAGWPIRLN